MSQDVVSDGINMIMNAKRARKQELEIRKYSKLFLKVLDIAKENGYIKDYDVDENNKVKIELGKLNKCSPIKPRFPVSADNIEKDMERFLPSRKFGILIISTSQGLMTHKEVLEKNIGGALIAYFY